MPGMTRVPAAAPALALLVLLAGLGGCSATINPALRQDAQTAARVKTALVNDPALGIHPIQVRVTNGLAELTGQVAHDGQIAQVVALVRQVTGVTDVRATLRVVPPGEAPGGADPGDGPAQPRGAASEPRQYEEPIAPAMGHGLLAVGASLRLTQPGDQGLGSRVTVGPSVRLGSGTGVGLAIGLGWMGTDLYGAPGASAPVAHLRIRPVMAGLGYTVRRNRMSASLSLVGGIALNSLKLPDRIDLAETALTVRHSLAWRPGFSLWIDVDDRVALNLFTGYLVTRPRMTLVEAGEIVDRRVRADSLVVSAGVAYKVF
jgi:hypothetical protein